MNQSLVSLSLLVILSLTAPTFGQQNQVIQSLISSDSKLKGFELPKPEDFLSDFKASEKVSILWSDLNNDKKNDLIVLLLNRKENRVLVGVYLAIDTQNHYEAIRVLMDEKSKSPIVHHVMKIKSAGDPSMSRRKYFVCDECTPQQAKDRETRASAYTKAIALELTYGTDDDPYYCTDGYYFDGKTFKKEDVCD